MAQPGYRVQCFRICVVSYALLRVGYRINPFSPNRCQRNVVTQAVACREARETVRSGQARHGWCCNDVLVVRGPLFRVLLD